MSLKSYGLDRLSGKENSMECKCAREEYYAEKLQMSYQKLQCDGFGNFNAYQCFEGGRECYCVDEDGSRISEVAPDACLSKYVRDVDPRIIKEDVCKGMRYSLKEMEFADKKCAIFDRIGVASQLVDCDQIREEVYNPTHC